MAKQQRIDPRAVERTRDSGYGAASKKPSNGKAPAAPSKGRGKSGRPGGRPEVEAHPAKFGDWVAAARIPTLALAIAPVALGTAAASLVTEQLVGPLGARAALPRGRRSRCRSASTTPTTTPTASAAPTRTGSDRRVWSARVAPVRAPS